METGAVAMSNVSIAVDASEAHRLVDSNICPQAVASVGARRSEPLQADAGEFL